MQEVGSELAGPRSVHGGARQENTLRKEREDGGHESHTAGACRDTHQTLPRQKERAVSDHQRGKSCNSSQFGEIQERYTIMDEVEHGSKMLGGARASISESP